MPFNLSTACMEIRPTQTQQKSLSFCCFGDDKIDELGVRDVTQKTPFLWFPVAFTA